MGNCGGGFIYNKSQMIMNNNNYNNGDNNMNGFNYYNLCMNKSENEVF